MQKEKEKTIYKSWKWEKMGWKNGIKKTGTMWENGVFNNIEKVTPKKICPPRNMSCCSKIVWDNLKIKNLGQKINS